MADLTAGGRAGGDFPKQGILFKDGDIVEHGEAAEEAAVEGAAARGAGVAGSTSLGIGSLKGTAS